MKRMTRNAPVLVVGLLLVVVGLGATLIAAHRHATRRAPVYTVYQIITEGYVSRLLPGQSLWLRGTATCGGDLYPTGCLIDGPVPGSQATVGLVVAHGVEDSLWTRLRSIPFLAPFVPPTAAHPVTGRTATYRVEFINCLATAACEQGVTQWRLESGGD